MLADNTADLDVDLLNGTLINAPFFNPGGKVLELRNNNAKVVAGIGRVENVEENLVS